MRFSYVFLAAFLIMSCNDEKTNDKKKVEDIAKKDEKKQEVTGCSTIDNFKKECLVGNWKIKSAKLGEKGQNLTDKTLTESQKGQNIDITNEKISGKILLVKADAITLEANPITLAETTYSFGEGTKKITFKKDQTTSIEVTVKEFNGKELTLELSGKTTGTPAKDYVLETVWSKE